MAKANLVLPDGTKVTIDGTAEEVALLLAKVSQPDDGGHGASAKRRKRNAPKSAGKKTGGKKVNRTGPTGLIAELANEGFFKSKRSLPEIQKKLEEKGHIYAQTSLSPVLVRLTRQRVLRRLKEKKGWVYVS